jgi:hypothetical protein
LAVVPGYRHYNFITSAEVPQIIGKFLADPFTNTPAGSRLAGRAATGEEAVGRDQKPERIGSP